MKFTSKILFMLLAALLRSTCIHDINLGTAAGDIGDGEYKASAAECQQRCQNHEECNYWIWHGPNADWMPSFCWIKRYTAGETSLEDVSKVPYAGSIGGVRDCSLSTVCALDGLWKPDQHDSILTVRNGVQVDYPVFGPGIGLLNQGNTVTWFWHNDGATHTGTFSEDCKTLTWDGGVGVWRRVNVCALDGLWKPDQHESILTVRNGVHVDFESILSVTNCVELDYPGFGSGIGVLNQGNTVTWLWHNTGTTHTGTFSENFNTLTWDGGVGVWRRVNAGPAPEEVE